MTLPDFGQPGKVSTWPANFFRRRLEMNGQLDSRSLGDIAYRGGGEDRPETWSSRWENPSRGWQAASAVWRRPDGWFVILVDDAVMVPPDTIETSYRSGVWCRRVQRRMRKAGLWE